MNNKIDIVDFAKDVLGVKLSYWQEKLLRKLQEAKENNETLVIGAHPRVGKTMIKDIMTKYKERNF
jgi:GTP1/Obg family GTP-binding protein